MAKIRHRATSGFRQDCPPWSFRDDYHPRSDSFLGVRSPRHDIWQPTLHPEHFARSDSLCGPAFLLFLRKHHSYQKHMLLPDAWRTSPSNPVLEYLDGMREGGTKAAEG